MTDDVKVLFGADTESFIPKVNAAGDAVKSSVGGMKDALGSLTGVFNNFFVKFTAVIGALAGGAAFKGFIDSANEMNAENVRLATTLGITGEEASVLRVAIGDVRLTTDEYLGTMQRFQRQLRGNEQALIDAGLKTRDGNNHLRDSKTLMAEALQIVNGYKQGVDRNTKAMELFGSRVGDLNKLMKLTPEVIEEARKKAESLNLVMTEEGKKASSAYEEAMNDVQDVTEGVSKTIGEAFMPAQTKALQQFAELGPQIIRATRIMIDVFVTTKDELLKIFGEIGGGLQLLGSTISEKLGVFRDDGPSALEIFGNALRLIPVAIIAFRVVFETVANIIVSGLTNLVLQFKMFSEVAYYALMRDWSGVKNAWKNGMGLLVSEVKAGLDRAKEIALKGRADIDSALTRPLGVKPTTTPAGKINKGGDDTNDETAKKRATLAKARLAEETALAKAELALQEELNREQEAELSDRYKNNLVTIKDYYTQELELARELADGKIREKERELEAAKKVAAEETDPAKRIEANAKVIEVNGQLKVLQAQRAEAFVKNTREMENAEEGLRKKLQEVRSELQAQLGLKQLDSEEAGIRQKRALLQIDAEQEIAMVRDVERRKYEIRREEIAQKKANGNLSRDALETLLKDELILEQDYVTKRLELDRQMELERQRYAIEAQSSIQGSLSTFIQDVANGTKSLKSAWLSLVSSIAQAITKMMADKLVQQFMNGSPSSEGSSGSGFGSILSALLGSSGAGGSGSGGGFGGARAEGGPVTGGKVYWVGERGPEMFVPNTAGAITPNGGGGGSVSIRNVFNLGAPTDVRTQQQIAAIAGRAVQEALRRNN